MVAYKTKVVKVKAGMFGGGDLDIEKGIQAELNKLDKGWTLHSCSIGGSERGIVAVLIFHTGE